MKKRVLAVLAALSLMLGLLPTGAMAVGESAQLASAQNLYMYFIGEALDGGDRGGMVGSNDEGTTIGDWGDNWSVFFYTDEAGTQPVPTHTAITYVPDSGTQPDAVEIDMVKIFTPLPRSVQIDQQR